jgi:hypothetical protein
LLRGASSRPHLPERVHIERQVKQFAVVVGKWVVRKTVKFREAIGVFPNKSAVGMKYMRSVSVDFNAVNVFGIAIPADMRTAYNYKTFFTRFNHSLGENRTE